MHRLNKHNVLKGFLLALPLVFASWVPLAVVSAPAFADPTPGSATTKVVCPDGHTTVDSTKVDTCPDAGDSAVSGGNCAKVTAGSCDLVDKYIQPLIDFLGAAVGVSVVISLVIGGIQYSSSGGDSSKITMAKNRIRNSLIALLMFLFLVAFINFLIPGGIV